MEGQEMSLYSGNLEEQDMDLRKGPWTDEEDAILVNYVSLHGEARWNNIARSSGLRRTGKSCRLRWLNYLRPDVRRGNITLQEQLMILELHSRWGNRWSKIAQFLPGRTDNEIKNYWRTRVQKQAKQLRCDVNSKLFKDTLRYVWMPRLAEQIKSQQPPPPPTPQTDNTIPNPNPVQADHHHQHLGLDQFEPNRFVQETVTSSNSSPDTRASTVSDQTGQPNRVDGSVYESGFKLDEPGLDGWEDWVCGGGGGDSLDSLWNEESFWVFQEQIMQ